MLDVNGFAPGKVTLAASISKKDMLDAFCAVPVSSMFI